MAIDFSALILAPCVELFGVPVEIDPVKSQPGSSPYRARGVFDSRQTDLLYEDGTALSTQITTLGIRQADMNPDGSTMFVVLPVRGDRCTLLDGAGNAITGRSYWVADPDDDGQGGLVLNLRLNDPGPI